MANAPILDVYFFFKLNPFAPNSYLQNAYPSSITLVLKIYFRIRYSSPNNQDVTGLKDIRRILNHQDLS